MKSLFVLLALFVVQTGSAQDVQIIIKPEKTTISKDEEISLDIFILNETSKPIEVPQSFTMDDGHTGTIVDLDFVSYTITDETLEVRGVGMQSHGATHMGTVFIRRGESKKYRLMWKCPNHDFDILILKSVFLVDGESCEGNATFTQERPRNKKP